MSYPQHPAKDTEAAEKRLCALSSKPPAMTEYIEVASTSYPHSTLPSKGLLRTTHLHGRAAHVTQGSQLHAWAAKYAQNILP